MSDIFQQVYYTIGVFAFVSPDREEGDSFMSSPQYQWVRSCILRYRDGDYGDTPESDEAMNRRTLKKPYQGCRMLASYNVPEELKEAEHAEDVLWIGTEWWTDDQCVTTVLWPSEY